MTSQTPLFAAAIVALGASALTQSAASAAVQDATHTHLLCPSAKVVGLPVTNESQKNLGEIGDVLVDPRSGELRYAVLEVGGFLGMGEDKRVIPWSYLEFIADEKDSEKLHARTNLTEAQLKAAPTCKVGQKFDADLDRRIVATFGKDDAWAYAGKGQPSFAWLSQMDGVRIEDKDAKHAGTIADVILAPQNGCVAYVTVQTSKEAGDKLVAVPSSQLTFAYGRDEVLGAKVPFALSRFNTAPEFASKDWKRMSSTAWMNEISTFYACDPFWKTSRFASARSLPTQRP